MGLEAAQLSFLHTTTQSSPSWPLFKHQHSHARAWQSGKAICEAELLQLMPRVQESTEMTDHQLPSILRSPSLLPQRSRDVFWPQKPFVKRGRFSAALDCRLGDRPLRRGPRNGIRHPDQKERDTGSDPPSAGTKHDIASVRSGHSYHYGEGGHCYGRTSREVQIMLPVMIEWEETTRTMTISCELLLFWCQPSSSGREIRQSENCHTAMAHVATPFYNKHRAFDWLTDNKQPLPSVQPAFALDVFDNGFD